MNIKTGAESVQPVLGSVLTDSTSAQAKEQVAILLGTRNGQRFLATQLDSIACQTHPNWHVYASDDGSVDGTQQLLKQYQARWGNQRLSLYNGPRVGFAANFLSLVDNPAINADVYAYADQDDLWHPHKLARALQWMRDTLTDQPALYCARTQLIDEQGNDLGLSPLFKKQPSFANALVQSIAGGNTMVFNQAARRLLRYPGNSAGVITHDWWTYLLITGHGGAVFYDTIPSVGYRQHGSNLVGSNKAWSAKLSRAKKLLEGRFRHFNDCNIQALQAVRALLSPENRQLLDQFCTARSQWWLPRALALQRCGIYRQRPVDNIGLILAILLGKL